MQSGIKSFPHLKGFVCHDATLRDVCLKPARDLRETKTIKTITKQERGKEKAKGVT